MQPDAGHQTVPWTRREFVRGAAAAVALPWWATAVGRAAEPQLAFAAADKEYAFDTGVLRGVLRSQGASKGLTPVIDAASGTALAKVYGLCSHYRLLDAEARYGTAAWDWASQAKLLSNGAVETLWQADPQHPFDLQAVYRWVAPNTLDVTTAVTARQDLPRFEVFLASYFEGFAAAFAYVQACPETGGKPGFLEAKQSAAPWQMFPRDEQAVNTIGDGRWRRLPNPVDWKIMPPLAGAVALRRDAATGLAGLVMAPPGDCFAVAMPFGEEGHRSLYMSLFGGDVKSGQTATARARLVLARGLSDEQAIALYEAYVKESR